MIVQKKEIKVSLYIYFVFIINIILFPYILLNSEIRLVINGTIGNNITSNNFKFDHFISEVIINGISNNYCKKICNLTNDLNNVTIIFNEQILLCESMFEDLENIIEVDLSDFDASKVYNMNKMFLNCTNLKKIIFGNFTTSSVTIMQSTFLGCKSLTSIDLSNFDTSSVTDMKNMFSKCENLKSIDCSSFNTSKVTDMNDMFAYCSNLESVNVSNFDTSKVKSMQGMFYKCHKLEYLDLSNFNSSSLTNIKSMFQECKSLKYLYLFALKDAMDKYSLLDGSYDNITCCVYDNNTKITITGCKNFDCSNIFFQKKLKEDINTDLSSLDITDIINTSFYEYPKSTFILNNETNIIVNNIFDSLNLTDNIYQTYQLNNISDSLNLTDNNYQTYQECFYKCKNCSSPGNETNNNCDICKDEFITINNQCYNKCEYYFYFDELNNYICTPNYSCPQKYKLIIDTNKCIDKCKNDDLYIFEFNNTCYTECPNGAVRISEDYLCDKEEKKQINLTINEKNNKICSFGEYIQKGYLNNIIKNISENKDDYIEEYNDIIFQITTSDNQKYNSNKNISTIDLDNCENILKEIYSINKSLPLIIFKIDYKYPDLLIPIIGYEIYHPENKSKLDLKYCNETIKLNIPVSIDENSLYKYDPNSEFYTDNCFSYTTDNGTDIILNDRKQEFKDNNMSLCENNCTYINYDKNTKQSACSCYIKNKMDLISEIIDNPNKLSNNFSSEESNKVNLNLVTMKCSKKLFSGEGLKTNISSYILMFSIAFFLLSIILFVKCGYFTLEIQINGIINTISKSQKLSNKNKIKKRKKYKNKKIKNPPIKIRKMNQDKEGSNLTNINEGNEGDNYKDNTKGIIHKKKNIIINNLNTENKDSNFNKIEFNIFELNTLSYKDALLYDKRTFCEYYISLLKTKNPLLFTFWPINDYNSRIIKICITIFSFSIYYAINFAFFDDKTIHKIYTDKGKYNFSFFIPKIFISFACSYIISLIIKYLFLSERNLLNIKKQTSIQEAEEIAQKEKKNITIKYFIFFILGISFEFFFWYLLSSFGAVYKNTQIIIFENTLICFTIALIYPFFINIFPSILRIHSLNTTMQKNEFMYKLSKILQLL